MDRREFNAVCLPGAAALLDKKDGFPGNEKVRIPLPGYLNDAAQLLPTFGQGQRLDAFGSIARRALFHDRRGRKENPARSAGQRQRIARQGIWRIEIGVVAGLPDGTMLVQR